MNVHFIALIGNLSAYQLYVRYDPSINGNGGGGSGNGGGDSGTIDASTGHNLPAPWVPFVKAGCNFGAFSTVNMVLENNGNDVTQVFGTGSPEANAALALVTSSERFELLNVEVLSRLVVNGAAEIGAMLQHVVNHSTYHRGQVVTMVRQSGGKPLSTDYLLYFDATT